MGKNLSVGVLLSGCGVNDGAEIHESVLTMLALEEGGAEVRCLAPQMPQARVYDHFAQQVVPDARRDVLVEAARIARGKIEPVTAVLPDSLDAVILPGGFGAALNFSDFAAQGAGMSVDPEVAALLLGMHELRRPIGALCIAPVLLAKVFGGMGVRLTIGNDPATAEALAAMGARHVPCAVDEIVVDEHHLLVTSPAYMLGTSIKDIFPGIRRLTAEILRLAAASHRL